jgi:uncharacterized protein YdeI (YjbR/CyaY-like superfamily)
MDESHPLHFKDRGHWREWLEDHYATEKEVWLVHYKKHTKTPCVSLEEAVEEALCFGWIDSKVKSVSEEHYIHKYSPRSEHSVWSKVNKDRAKRLIKEGRMTPSGMRLVMFAKKNGKWSGAYTSKKKLRLPNDLKEALKKNHAAWKNFQAFANTYQNMYIGWVEGAKRAETRKRRIDNVVKRSKKNLRFGLP